MSPEALAQRLAWLQHWMGREIASRQALIYPDRHWPMPRSIADATVVIDPANDKLYPSVNSNHVEHLGTSGLASKRILTEIVEMYRSAGVGRFFVYVSPSRQSAHLESWLVGANMVKATELSVLWRPAQPVDRPDSEIDTRLTLPHDANRLRCIVEDEDEFGYSVATLDMLGAPSFYTLLATLADVPVATGSLYVHQQLGYLGNGKTAEPFRCRGAQTALIAARVNLAAALGCSDVVSETYRFLETSFHNLQRAGFVELYARSIYRWEETGKANAAD